MCQFLVYFSFLILQKVNFEGNVFVLLVLENPSLYLICRMYGIYKEQCYLIGTV